MSAQQLLCVYVGHSKEAQAPHQSHSNTKKPPLSPEDQPRAVAGRPCQTHLTHLARTCQLLIKHTALQWFSSVRSNCSVLERGERHACTTRTQVQGTPECPKILQLQLEPYLRAVQVSVPEQSQQTKGARVFHGTHADRHTNCH